MREFSIIVLICSIIAGGAGLGTGHAQHLTVGVSGGYGSFEVAGDSDSEGMPLVGGYVDIGFIPFLGLEGSVEYGWKSQVGDTVQHSFSHLAVYTTAKYRMALPVIPLTPYLGAGGGWHRQDWGEQQDDFGIHFLGGVDYDLSGAVVGIMGRYAAVFGETETQQIFVVAGRVGYPVSLL